MSDTIAQRLAVRVENARRFSEIGFAISGSRTEHAEEIRETESSLTRLLAQIEEAASRGLTSLPVMQIVARHYSNSFLHHLTPLIGSPKPEKAIEELRGAAAIAVDWIKRLSLTPEVRIEDRVTKFDTGVVATCQEIVLVVRWPATVASSRTAQAA